MAVRFLALKQGVGHWAHHGAPRAPSSPLDRSVRGQGPDEGESLIVGTAIRTACAEDGVPVEVFLHWGTAPDGRGSVPPMHTRRKVWARMVEAGVTVDRPLDGEVVEGPGGGKTVQLERIMSQQEVADYFDVTVRTVQRWRRDGRGPRFLMAGTRPIYRVRDVVAWMTTDEGVQLGGSLEGPA